MEQNAKTQAVEAIKKSTSLLITVSTNPSVDQLAALIGLSLVINKLDKHGTAVFSGVVPSTLEFLQPEKMLEKDTDSLRDFIIALDKSKADKLRYKVEDEFVKIFITPYRVSLSDKDLMYSQGDYNVDTVIALGVARSEDLDMAILSHGKILHDATVITIKNQVAENNLGSINWLDNTASSLCEMVVELIEALGSEVLDPQISTSLLTGIVAETERFSNPKTSSKVMTVAAELMAAGANQQLIATELTKPELVVTEPIVPLAESPVVKTEEQLSESLVPEPALPEPQPGVIAIEHDLSSEDTKPPFAPQEEIATASEPLDDNLPELEATDEQLQESVPEPTIDQTPHYDQSTTFSQPVPEIVASEPTLPPQIVAEAPLPEPAPPVDEPIATVVESQYALPVAIHDEAPSDETKPMQEDKGGEIHIDEHGNVVNVTEEPLSLPKPAVREEVSSLRSLDPNGQKNEGSSQKFVTQPPTFISPLNATDTKIQTGLQEPPVPPQVNTSRAKTLDRLPEQPTGPQAYQPPLPEPVIPSSLDFSMRGSDNALNSPATAPPFSDLNPFKTSPQLPSVDRAKKHAFMQPDSKTNSVQSANSTDSEMPTVEPQSENGFAGGPPPVPPPFMPSNIPKNPYLNPPTNQ